MAHIYVDSAAVGAGTGASWANAYTTLKAAAEAGGTAAGDSIWVAHSHAETTGSALSITFKNTAAAPGTVLCVNKAGSVPPVSADLRTTATVTTTGASELTMSGFAYFYGIAFSAATGAVSVVLNVAAGTSAQYFKDCAIKNLGTSGGWFRIGYGSTTVSRCVLDNTPLTFGAVGQTLDGGNCELLWKNTPSALGGAVFPTTLIILSAAGTILTFEGVDLSAMTAGKTLVGAIGLPSSVILRNCKIDAGVTLASTPTTRTRPGIIFINCDAVDTNYRTERYAYEGKQTTETTVVRTDGASDGTTPISWRLETNADAELLGPLESLPIVIWNDTTGSRTVTVQGIWDGVAVPNNNQIWMEIEYLGNSGTSRSSFASSGLADVLATSSALAAGDGTWGGSTTKFKMASTVTVAEKGPITARVYVATPSTFCYIDPRITLT